MNSIKYGNFGDCQSVGDGVFELRLHFGPGYRIYFGLVDNTIVLLLCGGDKSFTNKRYCTRKSLLGRIQGDTKMRELRTWTEYLIERFCR